MGNFLSGNLGQTKCRATRRSGNSLLTAVVVASLGVMLMAAPRAASAMINVGGGFFCNATYYYVDGELQGVWYDNCFFDPNWGGGAPGPDPTGYHPLPGGGGGGGNTNPCTSGLVANRGGALPSFVPPTDPDDPGGGGSGGGSGGSGGDCSAGVPVKSVPSYSENPNSATCTSDETSRWIYANWAAVHYRATHLWSTKAGTILIIHYDDGGSEKWIMLHPTLSEPLNPVPMAGSLECPSGAA